ncbi:armadillo-type protein, partial [Tribonema minus]
MPDADLRFDKPAFAVVVSNHFKAVRQLYSTLAPAQLSEGIARVQLVTLLVKVMYRMVLLGMPQLQLQEGRVWLGQLVEHMQTIINALLQQRGQMGTDLVTALEKQLKRCALVLKDAQHDHAIAFAPFLPNALVFFHDTLLAVVDAAPSRDSVVAVQFAIQSVVFLSNVVGCSSYRADTLQSAVAKGKMAGSAGGDSPINAETATAIRQALDAFWTPARISQLCEWTIRHLLPLSPSDLQYWSDDPEAFVLEQDSLDVTESLRVAGEHLFLGMVESPDHGRQVVGIVEDMLTASAPQQLEAFATTSGITDTVFLVDALYLAVGLATMSLSGDMLRIWVQEVLGPGTRRMLAATTAPPLLLRRALWAVGCVANHLTAPIAADVASLVAAVLGGGAAQGDAAVQLAALSTLHGIVEQWVYDPSEALVPALGPLLDGLFSVLGRMRELEPRQQVLDALVAVIEIVSTALLPFANKLLEVMPLVWSAAEEQTPLRITCLTLMAQIVLAVGTTPGAAQALAPVVVPMIALACHVDARDADAYMITGGMELWLQYTRRCPAYTAELHALFLLLAGVLERDMECVKTGMLLLEAYALLGQQAMLSAYAEHVVRSLQTCAAQVKPDGAQFVTRALEAILNVAPREGAALLLPVLERLLVSVLASARGESSCEPDIVIVQHVTVLAHVLLAAPDVCAELLRRCSVGVVDLAHVMVHLFDAVGGGTPHRRRSWCLALLACLPQLRPEQVQELMDQVVNICVSALNDEECKSPVAGQSTHGGAGEDYGGLVIRLGIDSDQYRPLLLLPQQPHHTESVDLRQSIQR